MTARFHNSPRSYPYPRTHHTTVVVVPYPRTNPELNNRQSPRLSASDKRRPPLNRAIPTIPESRSNDSIMTQCSERPINTDNTSFMKNQLDFTSKHLCHERKSAITTRSTTNNNNNNTTCEVTKSPGSNAKENPCCSSTEDSCVVIENRLANSLNIRPPTSPSCQEKTLVTSSPRSSRSPFLTVVESFRLKLDKFSSRLSRDFNMRNGAFIVSGESNKSSRLPVRISNSRSAYSEPQPPCVVSNTTMSSSSTDTMIHQKSNSQYGVPILKNVLRSSPRSKTQFTKIPISISLHPPFMKPLSVRPRGFFTRTPQTFGNVTTTLDSNANPTDNSTTRCQQKSFVKGKSSQSEYTISSGVQLSNGSISKNVADSAHTGNHTPSKQLAFDKGVKWKGAVASTRIPPVRTLQRPTKLVTAAPLAEVESFRIGNSPAIEIPPSDPAMKLSDHSSDSKCCSMPCRIAPNSADPPHANGKIDSQCSSEAVTDDSLSTASNSECSKNTSPCCAVDSAIPIRSDFAMNTDVVRISPSPKKCFDADPTSLISNSFQDSSLNGSDYSSSQERHVPNSPNKYGFRSARSNRQQSSAEVCSARSHIPNSSVYRPSPPVKRLQTGSSGSISFPNIDSYESALQDVTNVKNELLRLISNVESAASNDAVLRENERLKEEILKRDRIIAERNRIIEELQARLRYLEQPC